MLFSAIMGVLLLIVTTLLTFHTLKQIKSGARFGLSVILLLTLTLGVNSGRILGSYQSQLLLLKEQKCLYRTEIQWIKGRDLTNPYKITADTVHIATIDYHHYKLPAVSAKFYVNNTDTLWSSATFNYQSK